jgi:hypothetical protein
MNDYPFVSAEYAIPIASADYAPNVYTTAGDSDTYGSPRVIPDSPQRGRSPARRGRSPQRSGTNSPDRRIREKRAGTYSPVHRFRSSTSNQFSRGGILERSDLPIVYKPDFFTSMTEPVPVVTPHVNKVGHKELFPYGPVAPDPRYKILPKPVAIDYASNNRVRVNDCVIADPPIYANDVLKSCTTVAYCNESTYDAAAAAYDAADANSTDATDCVVYVATPDIELSTVGDVGVMRRTFVATFDDEPFAVFDCVVGVTVSMKFYIAANGKRGLMSIETALHRNDGTDDRALTDVTALPALNVHLARYALPPFAPRDDADMTSDPFWADATRVVRDADTDAANFFKNVANSAVAKMWTYGMARFLATGTD